MTFKLFQDNSKGYTVIELMVTIAILGVLFTTIITSFSTKMNICGSVDREVELQQQGLFMLYFIEEKIIESKGIAYVEDVSGKLMHHTNEKVKIKKIKFENNENSVIKGYVFNLTKRAGTNYYNLLYGKDSSNTGTVEVGNFIENIELEPIPSDFSYNDSKGIVLRINLIYKENRFCVENSFCFRNKIWEE